MIISIGDKKERILCQKSSKDGMGLLILIFGFSMPNKLLLKSPSGFVEKWDAFLGAGEAQGGDWRNLFHLYRYGEDMLKCC